VTICQLLACPAPPHSCCPPAWFLHHPGLAQQDFGQEIWGLKMLQTWCGGLSKWLTLLCLSFLLCTMPL
jgi:hypothetical protein